jgi:hypothetical protein
MKQIFRLSLIKWVIVVLLGLTSCNLFTPDRPPNVPRTATYRTDLIKGGAYWIDFPEKLNDSTYKCVLYKSDGELWLRREYILDLKCSNKSYSIEEIRNNFDLYGGNYIRIKSDNPQGYCDLRFGREF